MRKVSLDELQAGIKIGGRNNNHLRYGDDTILGKKQRGTKEPLGEGEKESEKAGLKLNIQKNKTMASSSIASWQTEWEKVEAVTDFTFLGSKITVYGD